MNGKEECKGCKSNDVEGCYNTPFEKHSICPCSICLIKGMCSVPCGEYIEHQNIVSDITR